MMSDLENGCWNLLLTTCRGTNGTFSWCEAVYRTDAVDVIRRTHASLSRKAGIDPKLIADQLGHGLGVNLDVYTISDLGQRLESVNLLEQSLTSTAIN